LNVKKAPPSSGAFVVPVTLFYVAALPTSLARRNLTSIVTAIDADFSATKKL
jgi:hypothetical protein